MCEAAGSTSDESKILKQILGRNSLLVVSVRFSVVCDPFSVLAPDILGLFRRARRTDDGELKTGLASGREVLDDDVEDLDHDPGFMSGHSDVGPEFALLVEKSPIAARRHG